MTGKGWLKFFIIAGDLLSGEIAVQHQSKRKNIKCCRNKKECRHNMYYLVSVIITLSYP